MYRTSGGLICYLNDGVITDYIRERLKTLYVAPARFKKTWGGSASEHSTPSVAVGSTWSTWQTLKERMNIDGKFLYVSDNWFTEWVAKPFIPVGAESYLNKLKDKMGVVGNKADIGFVMLTPRTTNLDLMSTENNSPYYIAVEFRTKLISNEKRWEFRIKSYGSVARRSEDCRCNTIEMIEIPYHMESERDESLSTLDFNRLRRA